MKPEIDSFVKHNHPRYTDITSPGLDIATFRRDYVEILRGFPPFPSDAYRKGYAYLAEFGCLDAPFFIPKGSIDKTDFGTLYTTCRE